jgi:sugar O-acyltransferase (sialic acid O-acetyltransferase NeuD family)
MSFHVAIGHNPTRRRLAELIVALGGTLVTLVHPRAIMFESAVVDHGTFVAAGAVIGPGARVGADCIVNHGALVEHDVVLADHVNVSSGFVSGGRVRLEEGVFAGIGASVLPDVVVGRWTFLGAGAVVVSDATPHSLYIGVPARRVRVLGSDEEPYTPSPAP